MPPRTVKKAGKDAREEQRIGWRIIRISYAAARAWGVLLLLVVAAAVANVVYSRSLGEEGLIGRLFSVARRSVDKRISLMTSSKDTGDMLEQLRLP